jgi:hypothetical protein
MCVIGKIIPVETIPGMREIKENGRGGWIQVWYIVRTFVNATMYPHPAQQEKNNML